MNENLYIAHKKIPHKTFRVHSARYTQCIHVSSRKLKLPKDVHTKKYKQLLPTHPFPKVELYIAVKCKNIYRITNNWAYLGNAMLRLAKPWTCIYRSMGKAAHYPRSPNRKGSSLACSRPNCSVVNPFTAMTSFENDQ